MNIIVAPIVFINLADSGRKGAFKISHGLDRQYPKPIRRKLRPMRTLIRLRHGHGRHVMDPSDNVTEPINIPKGRGLMQKFIAQVVAR